ncbi:MAG: HPr family phosphocarrier protein [Pirellulales bacterium]|nr:HPr family phosphocarrier protein [Pirellulales bacterium]
MPSPSARNTVVINNPQGLHARPAELLARLAMQFESDVEVIRDGQCVDAKSILHVLTLGAGQGAEVTLQARGDDAQEAIEALTHLVESDFANDETMSQGSTSG